MGVPGALLVRIDDYKDGKRMASVFMQHGGNHEPLLLARDIDIVIGSAIKIVPEMATGSRPTTVEDGGPAPQLQEADVPAPAAPAPRAEVPPAPPVTSPAKAPRRK